MSKHRHSKDKMYLTYTENREDKGNDRKAPFERLPFYCCALSLAPFEDPVCTPDGFIFDILYVMPFIKKYQRNPVNGNPLKPSDLIKMHWTKSDNPDAINEYQDPISYKIFTETTHIVCIRTSGYVYAYDTINELNKKTKFFFDLVTNEPFEIKDIIHIQDPKSQKARQVAQFDYLKKNLPFIPPEKIQPEINQTETLSRVFEQMEDKKKQKREEQEAEVEKKRKKKEELESREDVKGFIQWCIENKVFKHERETDMGSASLTSTNFTPNQKAMMTFRELKQSQIREKIYAEVRKGKMKGFIQMQTNLGNINFLIHADLVTKTAENFLQLSESGYFDGTKFHRLVHNFCLQGGDPSGTGSGGESVFGKAFQDQFHQKLVHSKAGILSMANSGPETNQSQFFITLGQCQQLDKKHSVFGEIISNEDILSKINRDFTQKNEKPKQDIIIIKMYCYDNPFRKAIKKLKEKYEENQKNKEKQEKEKEKERWIDESNKFKLPFAGESKKNKTETLSNRLLEDYY